MLLFLGGFCLKEALAQKKTYGIDESLKVSYYKIENITGNGRYAAFSSSEITDWHGVKHERFGDPFWVPQEAHNLNILNTQNNTYWDIFGSKKVYEHPVWSADNHTLAFLLYEDQKISIQLYDANERRLRSLDINTDLDIASVSDLVWGPSGNYIYLELRSKKWKMRADSVYRAITNNDILIQDSKDNFLAWDYVHVESEKTIPVQVDVSSGEVTQLAPEGIFTDIIPSEKGAYLSIIREQPIKTAYHQSYPFRNRQENEYHLYRVSLDAVERPDTLMQGMEDYPGFEWKWNHSGTAFAFTEKGKVFTRSITDTAKTEPTAVHYTYTIDSDTTELRYQMLAWGPDDTKILVHSNEGYHLLDRNGKGMSLVWKIRQNQQAPRRSFQHWTEDGRYIYFTYSARNHWARGLSRLDLETGDMEDIKINSDLYEEWTFSDNGNTILYQRSDGNFPSELYQANATLDKIHKVTRKNDWMKDYKVSRNKLISYMDVDGDSLFGVLYYPVDYEKGKKYPLVSIIYERFFQNGFWHYANLLANRNYFVLRPSVNFDIGYPGEAWIKGVTPAINKLIGNGMVDEDKLGVQGTSYGGYGVNLLITQTDRFAAAINNSGKTNMISFLGDSPKLGSRNYIAPEATQDRIGETFWEAPDKYITHSAIFYADRIETPLLILTGENDENISPQNQGEMYYALRRLGKKVKWVRYMHAGHGAGRDGRTEDYRHQWNTIFDWYGKYFKEN